MPQQSHIITFSAYGQSRPNASLKGVTRATLGRMCYTCAMGKGRISPIQRKKAKSRKTKARLARKAEVLKRIAHKRNRVHRRKR
jgi:hypothetical protein